LFGPRLWSRAMRGEKAAKKQMTLNFHHFNDGWPESEFQHLIRQEFEMILWQLRFCTGYLHSLRSTLQYFPLGEEDGLVSLYAALGQHPSRAICVLWGEEDKCCPVEACIELSKSCLPRADVFLIEQSGHRVCIENFHATAEAVLAFVGIASNKIRGALHSH
jgi:hypothetical protein